MSVDLPSDHGTIPLTLPEPLWRLTVGQYHKMVQLGILTEDDPVELIEGVLAAKMPKNPPHRAICKRVYKSLEKIVPSEWSVDSQEPITLEDSEPEPDIVVAYGDTSRLVERHPGAEDVALVVEVADTTLKRDRSAKKRVYARARLPVYWIVNLVDRQVEVYSDPTGPCEFPDYGQQQNYSLADQLPVVIAGQVVGRIQISDLLD